MCNRSRRAGMCACARMHASIHAFDHIWASDRWDPRDPSVMCAWSTANLRTGTGTVLDFRGFDSSRISVWRGGTLTSIEKFPGNLESTSLGRDKLSREIGRLWDPPAIHLILHFVYDMIMSAITVITQNMWYWWSICDPSPFDPSRDLREFHFPPRRPWNGDACRLVTLTITLISLSLFVLITTLLLVITIKPT